jgi:hypothetical protein
MDFSARWALHGERKIQSFQNDNFRGDAGWHSLPEYRARDQDIRHGSAPLLRESESPFIFLAISFGYTRNLCGIAPWHADRGRWSRRNRQELFSFTTLGRGHRHPFAEQRRLLSRNKDRPPHGAVDVAAVRSQVARIASRSRPWSYLFRSPRWGFADGPGFWAPASPPNRRGAVPFYDRRLTLCASACGNLSKTRIPDRPLWSSSGGKLARHIVC